MNPFIYKWTDLFFKTITEKNITIETQSFWESEDLDKILDAQNLIFKGLSPCISLIKNLFI